MEEKLRLFWEFYAKWCDAPMSMEDFTQKAFLAGWSAAEHSVQADGAYCECIEPFSRAKVIDGVCSFCRSPRR